ncbi:MAG: prolyl aminopeptidase [Burkholderiales bacterium]|nr:prolyl aminopeptidase [Burkholderiales bacterium]
MTLDEVLHPPTEVLRQGRLAVGDGHELHWETCGTPEGIPALFLHGGPGAGISPTSRRFFDARRYHVTLFDQRGAGRSTPLGATHANTTPLLIDDIERLRVLLGIERWLVFGGSWGSTLALAYAQAHPQRCLGLVLRGIWLGSQEEIDWWLYGMRQFYPREWEAFAGHVGAEERGDLLAAYQRRLTHPDPAIHTPAARAWSRYEGACLHLVPRPEQVEAFGADAMALGVGRLEAHYFAHQAFLAPDQLLNGMSRIAHLPGVIVQGRYDVICPPRYAHALADVWPGGQLRMVIEAGHSSMEPGIAAELVAATDRFARTGGFA